MSERGQRPISFHLDAREQKTKASIDKAKTVPLASLFTPIWPVAGLVAATILNLAWIGFLGYGLFKLLEPAFS